MVWIIDQLVAFLIELKSMSLVSQVLTLAGIPSLGALVFGIPVWLMTRKVRDFVVAHEALEQRLSTALREAAKLQAQVNRLEAETPEAFIAHHAAEMKDQNDERAMALAEAFLQRQTDALLLAFRTRMNEAILQSVEDGAQAFEAAQAWALAALALAPRDRMLRMLIEELGGAAAIAAASSGRVKLKGDENRRTLAQRYERLPSRSGLYQSPYALTALAQSRVAIEVIVAGLATRAFQASQQASTMAV